MSHPAVDERECGIVELDGWLLHMHCWPCPSLSHYASLQQLTNGKHLCNSWQMAISIKPSVLRPIYRYYWFVHECIYNKHRANVKDAFGAVLLLVKTTRWIAFAGKESNAEVSRLERCVLTCVVITNQSIYCN